MRVLFMGTPEFAAVSLQYLAENGFNVAGVVTQPDRPKGRGHRMQAPPVKELAITLGLPVYQPESLKNGAFMDTLREIHPDVIVVVAYGKILPADVLTYPEYGCINVHASLLPKYRGAAPIERCVMDGETVTGVTTMHMDAGIDTGDMLLREQTEIGTDETAAQLRERLGVIGAKLLVQTLHALQEGAIRPMRQDEALATYAPMLTREDGRMDFTRPGQALVNQVRAVPTFAYYQGKKWKVLKASFEPLESATGAPGEILKADGGGIAVCVPDGQLILHEIQAEGKKPMAVSSYLLGNAVEIGTVLCGKEPGELPC